MIKIRPFDLIERYANGMTKDLTSEKEDIKCSIIMKK